jgi:hypothetical protein
LPSPPAAIAQLRLWYVDTYRPQTTQHDSADILAPLSAHNHHLPADRLRDHHLDGNLSRLDRGLAPMVGIPRNAGDVWKTIGHLSIPLSEF